MANNRNAQDPVVEQDQNPEAQEASTTQKMDFMSMLAPTTIEESETVNVFDMASHLRDEELISITLNLGEFQTTGAQLKNRASGVFINEEREAIGGVVQAPRQLEVGEGHVVFKVTKRPSKRPGSESYLAAAVEVKGLDENGDLKTAGFIGVSVDPINGGYDARLRDQSASTYKRVPDATMEALISKVPLILKRLTDERDDLKEVHKILKKEAEDSAAMRAMAQARGVPTTRRPMAPTVSQSGPAIDGKAADAALDSI